MIKIEFKVQLEGFALTQSQHHNWKPTSQTDISNYFDGEDRVRMVVCVNPRGHNYLTFQDNPGLRTNTKLIQHILTNPGQFLGSQGVRIREVSL